MKTRSICSECLNTVPAEILYEDNKVFLEKTCPTHGIKKVLIEVDVATYESMHTPTNPFMHDLINAVILNTTDRCNQDCLHCYHMPENTEDPSIESLVERAEKSSCNDVILMGAEPTVRKDLPELISAINKPTSIYTNGIKLADHRYLKSLFDAGLTSICMSLHTEKYNNNKVIWEKKQKAMKLLEKYRLPVHHLSFSIDSPEDIEDVFREAHKWWNVPHHFRVRIPGRIGKCGSEPLFMSEFIMDYVEPLAEDFGWEVKRLNDDDNPYHVNLVIEGKIFRFIRWASIDEIDLGELGTPPMCQFDDEIGEVNFMHGAIVQAEKKLRAKR